MISVDIIEYKRYDFYELNQKFKCNEKNTITILKKLKNYGIVKSVNLSNDKQNLSDIMENDNGLLNNEKNNYVYVFKYVGIIIIFKLVIKCYPKYLKNNKNLQRELKQIIKILKKYKNSKKENFKLQDELNKNSSFNMLSLMLYFIEDYYINGIYTDTQKIIEMNGNGEILWDKTINEIYPLIQKNKPYYFNLYTKRSINDYDNYFKRLHEVILTKCSEDLERADILNLFDLTPINLNKQQKITDFGEKYYIKSKIIHELNIQFNSHKQNLLKAMYAYINHSNSYMGDIDYFNTYGTNTYNLIWEEMCSHVLNNKRDDMLGSLKLPNDKLNPKYKKNQTLLSIIEKPKWFILNDELNKYNEINEDTLIPDLITFNDTKEGTEFIILDAKYYSWPLNSKPGIGDIIKQYIYELAYKDFIKLNGFINSKNCFLFPIDDENIINKGYVELKMLRNLGLKNIQIILLPAKRINQLYLENKQLNISELKI